MAPATQGSKVIPRPLLFTYRRCPYAMRARMALLWAGRTFDAWEIVLRDKPPALREASPKATVPVLLLEDGSVLEQSLDIMQWALTDGDSSGAWARGQSSRNQALLAANDGVFKVWLDRYKYPQRSPDWPPDQSRAQAVAVLLEPLEQALQSDLYLGGTQPCATDWALFPFVRQFRAVDADWFDAQPWSATHRWLAHWLESPLFLTSMQKLPVNQPGPWPATTGSADATWLAGQATLIGQSTAAPGVT